MADEERDVDMAESGDEDSSSSNEEVEMNPEDENKIINLESQLEANPTIYDTHVQLIEVLGKCKLRERLRQARQRMHELFPFNESQWMDWINDEMESISSAEDVDRIRQLFQLAVQDYISVSIWESYLEFLKAADPEVSAKTAAGAETFRQAAEAALTAAGLHLAEGHHIWQLYRAYEQEAADASGDEKQLDRVRGLFHRQLQLPHTAAAELLAEYEAWEASTGNGAIPDHIRAAAQRSASAAQLRTAHESAVAAGKEADASLLAAYMAYIQLEKSQKDPARVQILYERALAVFPVTSELWLQYTRYLEEQLKVPAVINKAYARAVRNCPWVGALWAAALRALERSGGSDAEHAALAEKALKAGMQGPEDYLSVLLARADCLRHQLPTPADSSSEAAGRLRAWLEQALTTMTQYFPDAVDRSLRLPGYWAHIEGVVLGDLAAMRAVWEATVKGPLGRYYETWLAWVNMERGLRQLDAARSLFKRAHRMRFEEGGQLSLAYEWIKFEREEGSAEELFQASCKVDPLIEGARAAATAAANQPAAAVARAAAQNVAVPALLLSQAAAQNAKKLSREEIKAMRRANDPNFKERKPGTKRDADGNVVAAADDATSPPSSKRNKSKEPDPHDANMTDAGVEAAAAAGAPGERPHYTDEHTVFVKGLGFDVSEDDLRRLFAELGVKSVRMGRDKFTGASRGFAYVDFETDDAVHKASEKDGQVVNGRKLFIAKSAPPGGGRGRGFGRGVRGRGDFGWGRGAAAAAADGHEEEQGGGGFRGGRGAGRGRRGLGYHQNPAGAVGNMGHMRHHLQTDDERTAARTPMLVPRALVTKAAGAGQQQQQGGEAGALPKTNEDFKKMLQK